MGKSSKDKIEELSTILYAKSTPYKFPKSDKLPKRYIDGKLSAYDWLNELCFYFLQQDKQLFKDFKCIVQEKKSELNNLKDGPYKNGIMNTFNEFESIVNKIK